MHFKDITFTYVSHMRVVLHRKFWSPIADMIIHVMLWFGLNRYNTLYHQTSTMVPSSKNQSVKVQNTPTEPPRICNAWTMGVSFRISERKGINNWLIPAVGRQATRNFLQNVCRLLFGRDGICKAFMTGRRLRSQCPALQLISASLLISGFYLVLRLSLFAFLTPLKPNLFHGLFKLLWG